MKWVTLTNSMDMNLVNTTWKINKAREGRPGALQPMRVAKEKMGLQTAAEQQHHLLWNN